MLKKVFVWFGLVCFVGLGFVGAAQVGSRVKKEESKSAKSGPVETKSGVKFVYKGSAENVFVAGSFNDWSATKNPLKQVKPNIWEVVLPLDAGKYQYKFVVDGNWLVDSENPETSDDGLGGKNSIVEVKKGAEKSAVIKGGPVETAKGVKFVCKGPAENVFVAGSFNDWSTTKNQMKQSKKDVWEIVLPLDAGKYQYKFVVDGNWLVDSENPNTTDDGLGGKNSVIEIKKGAQKSAIKSKGPVITKDGVKFTLTDPNISNVYLAGSFNNWSASQDAMKKDSSGNWTITKKLNAGKYQYKFVSDGNWLVDPENPNTADDGFGGKNSVIEVK